MSDLKPIGQKAPLNLLPAISLRAISAAMQHGAMKYAPWNWQDNTSQATIDELLAALLRHTTAVCDPSEDEADDESGLHHLCHAGACIVILLYKLGVDYKPSKFITKGYVDKDEVLHEGTEFDEEPVQDPAVCPNCKNTWWTATGARTISCSECGYQQRTTKDFRSKRRVAGQNEDGTFSLHPPPPGYLMTLRSKSADYDVEAQ